MLMVLFTNLLGESEIVKADNPTAESITNYVNDYLKRTKIPGLNIIVTSPERVLYQDSFGIQQVGSKQPMSSEMPSPIGSLTKSITALALLQQVDKGLISLDDKVIDYIPWYTTFNKDKSDTITIEMLLNNSSGLPHNVDIEPFIKHKPSMDFEKALKEHEKVRLLFDPDTSYSYSNEGFMIAGYILELVTGISYHDYVMENIFKPLEMLKTTTSIEELLETEFLHGHLAGVDGFLPANKIYSGIMIPAGSELISTTSDLSHYAQMLMNKGTFKGKQVLSKDIFKKYLSDGILSFKMQHVDLAYQCGWMHIKDSPLMFHMGQTLSASSILLIDKESKVAVSILCNVSDVVNGKDSIYNLALYLLQLYVNKDYHLYEKSNVSILNENTTFIDKDKSIIGQYMERSGLVKASVSETKSGSYEVTIRNALGASTYELSFISSQDVYTKNVGSESMIKLKRSTDNTIIGITHPMFGNFDKVNTRMLTGYYSISNDYMSSILPESYTFSNFTLLNGDIELQMKKMDLNGEGLPDFINKTFDQLKNERPYDGMRESTTLREFTMNGLTCYEQIQIVDIDDCLYAHVFYCVFDLTGTSSIIIYGAVPFNYLTHMRLEVIQPFIQNLNLRT